MKKAIFWLILLLGITLEFTAPTSVAAESFTIDNYMVDMKVTNDWSLAITETIDVQFSEPKHGIERLLPQRYEHNDTQDEITDYNNITTNVPKSTYIEWKNVVLRLGDPDHYVTDSKQYVISYTATPWVKQYSGRQELYWNLVGTQWWVPIRQASFRIATPQTINLKELWSWDIQVVAGDTWSTGWIQTIIAAHGVVGKVQNLWINQWITIGIKFKDNSFSSLAPVRFEAKKQGSESPTYNDSQTHTSNTSSSESSTIDPIWIIFFGISLLGWAYKRYLKKQKEKLAWPIVTQYSPPPWLTPAIAGYIDNDQFDVRDFMATLYDWWAKWYLTIEEQVESWIITDTTHIVYHKKQTPTNLSFYEQTIWDKMFGQSDSFDFALLDQSWLVNEEKQFFDSIVESIKLSWQHYYMNAWWIGWLFGYKKPTEEWIKIFAHLRGYRDFIEHVEKDKIQEFLNQDPLFVDKILPWAIIFGCESTLLKQLESVASRHQPTRYVGNTFSYVSMNHMINNGMKTLNKAYDSAYPKRSSWFSGWGIRVWWGGWGGWGRSW